MTKEELNYAYAEAITCYPIITSLMKRACKQIDPNIDPKDFEAVQNLFSLLGDAEERIRRERRIINNRWLNSIVSIYKSYLCDITTELQTIRTASFIKPKQNKITNNHNEKGKSQGGFIADICWMTWRFSRFFGSTGSSRVSLRRNPAISLE